MNMKKNILSLVGAGALMIFGAAVVPVIMPSFGVPIAQAASNSKSVVDAAKAQGLVGEQADGYLGLVKGSASADVRAAVADINIQRKTHYTNMATQKGESVDNVAKVFALSLIKRASTGQKVRDASGRWVTK